MTHQYMGETDTSGTESARLDTNSVIRIIYHCVLSQIKICTVAYVYKGRWIKQEA